MSDLALALLIRKNARSMHSRRSFLSFLGRGCAFVAGVLTNAARHPVWASGQRGVPSTQVLRTPRARRSLNEDWRFIKGDPPGNTVSLLYDVRPQPVARG